MASLTPSTATESVQEQQIKQFADQNGAFYSLDWGRLLLPRHGQIFRDDSYLNADVNNHVIGRMQSTGRAIDDAPALNY